MNGKGKQNMISLVDIILILARHLKVIIIVPTVLCSIVIIHLLFFAESTFTSTSKIMSSSGGGGNSQALGFAAQFGINLSSSQGEPKWVYPEIIKSRTLAKALLKRKFNTKDFGDQVSLLKILIPEDENLEVKDSELETIATDMFLNMIEISEDLITLILTLRVHASEPVLASDINKAIIKELEEHQKNYNRQRTSDAKNFIEERINDTEKELMNAEENLKIFLDRNRRIENSPSLQLEQQRLSREVAVLTGVFTTLKQQLETTKIEEVKESDYVIILDQPEIPLKRSKPRRAFTVIFTGIIGLVLGAVLAFILNFFQSRNKKDKDKINEAIYLVFKNIKELIMLK